MKGAALLLAIALAAGCAHRPVDDRLYRALGGHEGISAIVEGLLFRIVENPRIAHHFADTDIFRLREKLIEQFCVEAGGPCVYTGEPMDIAHAGRMIDEGAFNALVEDLQLAMDALDVPVAAQNGLIARLALMRPQIIHR